MTEEMSDEYTPDDETVANSYARGRGVISIRALAEFDRWLAAHDREVAAKVRADVLEEIDWLMTARNEYTDERVHEHMEVVRHLLRVLEDDEFAAEGWLPSWRWDAYTAIREARS